MKQIVIFYPTLAKVTNYVSFCSKIPTIMLPKTDDDILNSKQQKNNILEDCCFCVL